MDELYTWRNDPDVPVFPDDAPLMVFDAACMLCSGAAQFILRHDRSGRVRISPAQSDLGAALYRHLGLPTTHWDTVLFLKDGRVRTDSDAVIALAETLGGPWRLAALLRLLPATLRDDAYRVLARNRYRWFGRRDACWLPSAKLAERVL